MIENVFERVETSIFLLFSQYFKKTHPLGCKERSVEEIYSERNVFTDSFSYFASYIRDLSLEKNCRQGFDKTFRTVRGLYLGQSRVVLMYTFSSRLLFLICPSYISKVIFTICNMYVN